MSCPVCVAKDQTIVVLADEVDWLRAQLGGTVLQKPSFSGVHEVPEWAPPGALWASDEEEDITAALEHGALSKEAAEEALSRLQALNQTVEVV